MRHVPILLSFIAITAGCSSAEPGPSDDHDHHDGDYAAQQEALSSISCTERSDTGYVSGSPFSIKVVTVDGKPVEKDTANAYYVMARAAEAQGVLLRVVSGFRTQSEQQYLYSCYVNCSCNNCNLAARPGYSNHQSGYALDLNTAAPGVLSWLNANAGYYGFIRTVPSEPWHWEFRNAGPGGGPCTDEPPAPAHAAIEVYWARQADGRYELRALAPQAVTRVEYKVDTWEIGSASRTDGHNFPASYSFTVAKNERFFEVLGYDDEGDQVGRGIGLLDVTDGVGVYIKQMGESLYEIGLERAPAGVAFIRVSADGYTLTDSVTGSASSNRAAVRSKFLTLGERNFAIDTFNTDGSYRGTLRRTFVLE